MGNIVWTFRVVRTLLICCKTSNIELEIKDGIFWFHLNDVLLKKVFLIFGLYVVVSIHSFYIFRKYFYTEMNVSEIWLQIQSYLFSPCPECKRISTHRWYFRRNSGWNLYRAIERIYPLGNDYNFHYIRFAIGNLFFAISMLGQSSTRVL